MFIPYRGGTDFILLGLAAHISLIIHPLISILGILGKTPVSILRNPVLGAVSSVSFIVSGKAHPVLTTLGTKVVLDYICTKCGYAGLNLAFHFIPTNVSTMFFCNLTPPWSKQWCISSLYDIPFHTLSDTQKRNDFIMFSENKYFWMTYIGILTTSRGLYYVIVDIPKYLGSPGVHHRYSDGLLTDYLMLHSNWPCWSPAMYQNSCLHDNGDGVPLH